MGVICNLLYGENLKNQPGRLCHLGKLLWRASKAYLNREVGVLWRSARTHTHTHTHTHTGGLADSLHSTVLSHTHCNTLDASPDTIHGHAFKWWWIFKNAFVSYRTERERERERERDRERERERESTLVHLENNESWLTLYSFPVCSLSYSFNPLTSALLLLFLLFRYLDEVSSVLLFPSLRQEDGGSYTCTATNAVASDAQTVNLVVKGEVSPVSCVLCAPYLPVPVPHWFPPLPLWR